MNNLVSVIIPCYNQANFLGEAIASALAQTYPHFEIIVVDDGSTDNTLEVAAQYPGVRCIHQDNQGLAAARNSGFRESVGEYLVFVDSDDRLLPNALEMNLEFLNAHPKCAFVSGHIILIDSEGLPLPTPPAPTVDKDHYLELLRCNYIWTTAAIMYRRFVFETLGGFDNAVSPAADYEFSLRIARTFPIFSHDKVIAEYRQHGSSMSVNAVNMLKSVLAVLHLQHKYIKKDRRCKRALKVGIRLQQSHYGSELADRLQTDIKNGKWKVAMREMLIFLRYYPKRFIKYFSPGLYCSAVRIINTIWRIIRNLKRQAVRKSIGAITANYNPIQVSGNAWLGKATLSWNCKGAEAIEIHIDAPDGPLLIRAGPSGDYNTGERVHDGMVFYLQDVSVGLPLTSNNTLATVIITVINGEQSANRLMSSAFKFISQWLKQKIFINQKL